MTEIKNEGHRDLNPNDKRPGARTIVACVEDLVQWKLCRVSLTLEDAIDEETTDYPVGLKAAIEKGSAADADDYARQQPDIALWEGERCLAVIRPRAGGDPEITRFDGEDDGRPLPEPSTDAERAVWGMVKQYGADECSQAILARMYPDLGPKQEAPIKLTTAEGLAVDLVRKYGEDEAMDRLLMAGAYGAIRNVILRLGSDAVAELLRIIATGNVPVEVRAATVIGSEPATKVVEETVS